MKTNYRIALGQIDSRWGAKEANLNRMSIYIRRAAADGASLIVFPEMALTGYRAGVVRDDLEPLAEAVPGPATDKLMRLARTHDIAITFGMLERSGNHLYNTAVLLIEDSVFTYRKTHVHWTEQSAVGHALPVWQTKLGHIGMLICFDLAFPEAARVLALAGAEVIIAPSAVPTSFRIYTERRVVARALDNQCYVLYCNFAGEGFDGNSLVINPRGDVIVRAGVAPDLVFGIVDLATESAWRQEERIFSERHPRLYAPIAETAAPAE